MTQSHSNFPSTSSSTVPPYFPYPFPTNDALPYPMSNDNYRLLWFIVEGEDDFSYVNPHIGYNVGGLKELIYEKGKINSFDGVDANKLVLWKLKRPPPIEPLPDVLEFIRSIMPIDEKNASKLHNTASKVGSEFQQPFDEDRLHLFVQRPVPRKRSLSASAEGLDQANKRHHRTQEFVVAVSRLPTSDGDESKGVLTTFGDVSFFRMRAVLGDYYVDKTELVEKIISMGGANVDLVLRPRRCGKSAMLSMLWSFFSLNEPNQPSLFEGLYIASKRDICEKHMGKYAVIHFDLKNIHGQTWDIMQDVFGKKISDLYETWEEYLQGSLSEKQSREYNTLISRSASTGDLQGALTSLSSLLAKKSGRGVVVLIDEYEAPINCAFEMGYFDQANEYFGRGVFPPLLKGNRHISFAVLAGVSPTAKSGWFSGLNSLEMHPLHARNSIYAGRVMFTEPEVERLMLLSRSPLGLDDLKAHYNSYVAGGTISVYNPVSIIQALRTGKIDDYWVATGRYPLLAKSLATFDTETLESFEKLLKREEVNTALMKDVHFNLPDLDCSGVLTLLYYGGYLTMTSSGGLTIPNLEVLADWSLWITNTEPTGKNIFSLCVKGPVSAFETTWPIFMQSTLHPKLVAKQRGAESRKTPERVYHVYLLGLLHGLRNHGWVTNVEEPSGLGYIDIRIFSKVKRTGVLIELKSSVTSEQLDQDADNALRQIIDKNYRSKLTHDGAQRIREYGIACFHLESKVKGRYMVWSGDSWLESPDPATREGGD